VSVKTSSGTDIQRLTRQPTRRIAIEKRVRFARYDFDALGQLTTTNMAVCINQMKKKEKDMTSSSFKQEAMAWTMRTKMVD
jgi:hypothetical protein